jgi:hypothetical protein
VPGAAGAGLFLRVEARAATPLIHPALLRDAAGLVLAALAIQARGAWKRLVRSGGDGSGGWSRSDASQCFRCHPNDTENPR